MANDPILALALLKTNWELHHRSYVDNFNVLTLECLRKSSQDVVSAPDLQYELRQNFGLNLPTSTVVMLLKRAAKQGFLAREHGVYTINRPALADTSFQELQQRHIGSQDALFTDLASFATTRFSLTWTVEDAEHAIHGYLAEDAITVLRATSTHSYVPLPKRRSKSDKYVLASYVNSLVDSGSPHFEYLRRVAEGNVLARGIFLADSNADVGRKFHDIRVFFDTRFILSSLGHAGASLKAPNVELLGLLRRSGARLGCFAHTLDEVRSVLTGCARNLRSGSRFFCLRPFPRQRCVRIRRVVVCEPPRARSERPRHRHRRSD